MPISIIDHKDIYLDDKFVDKSQDNNKIKLGEELCVNLNGERLSDVFEIFEIFVDKQIRDRLDDFRKEYFACELRSKNVEVYKVGELCYIKILNKTQKLDLEKDNKDYISCNAFGKMYDVMIGENKNADKDKYKVLLSFHEHKDGPKAIMEQLRKDYEKFIETIPEFYTIPIKQNINFDKDR